MDKYVVMERLYLNIYLDPYTRGGQKMNLVEDIIAMEKERNKAL